MRARIYRPAKTAMQSGKGKSQIWHLDFDGQGKRWVEPLMGYTATNDTSSQVRMTFASRDEAVAYAERNQIEYRVVKPKEPKRRPMAYSDNFAFNRQMPWTH